jgi:hypothetical protein
MVAINVTGCPTGEGFWVEASATVAVAFTTVCVRVEELALA